MLYGSSVLALFALLEKFELPSFYDKLLPVPLLNLTIQLIDKAAESDWLKKFDPALLGRALTSRKRNLAYMAIWAGLFVTMQMLTGEQATLARGDSLKAQGRLEEAIARYREFAESEPADFDGHRKLAAALLEAGRPIDALPALRRTVELRSDDAEAHHNLGYALLQSRNFERAEEEFRYVLRLDPDYAAAHYGLGLAMWADGRHQESLDWFREGVRRWPSSAEAHYNLGAVLERNGQLDEAMGQYRKSVELEPSHADANFSLGVMHETRGEHVLAVERFRRVLESDPDSARAQTQLAWLLATSPDAAIRSPGMAVALAQHVVARTSGQDATALDVLAAALAATGQFERAASIEERTIALLGSHADADTLGAARARLALYRDRKVYRSDRRSDRVEHP